MFTMSLLQVYQAELLTDLDEGKAISPNTVCELRQATYLSLRATKEMAKSIGRSMAALVATERHLWLNLSNIKGKDKNFLMDAPIFPFGLFGGAVNSVIEGFQESAKQAARNSSPAAFISPGLLSGSSPKHLKPAPATDTKAVSRCTHEGGTGTRGRGYKLK